MMNYARLLEGKTAVITSGAHGMGKAIARVFARHGARCVINGMNPDGEETANMLREISPDSFFARCDMSKREDVESFIGEALRRAGHVDIVVHNVGVNLSDASHRVEDERFEYTQQVNLRGAMRLAKGFLPGMMAAGGGAFVHISTVHAVSAIPANTAYSSSKSALNGFSGALAADYARYGVRSNVVCPGGVYTRNSEEIFAAMRHDDARMLAYGLSGEEGQPDYGAGSPFDIAHASLFLASDMARHITGAVVMSDGGVVLQSQIFRNRRLPPDYHEQVLQMMRNRFEPVPGASE